MAQYQVTCITLGPSLATHENDHQRITHVGGADWRITVAEAILSIEMGNAFYVTDDYGNTAWVRVVTPTHGPKYLRTVKDGKYTDNLRALPACG